MDSWQRSEPPCLLVAIRDKNRAQIFLEADPSGNCGDYEMWVDLLKFAAEILPAAAIQAITRFRRTC